MKFHVKIAKGANFYFFVQNLARWHFSTVPSFNTYWEQQFGSLSRRESRQLAQFTRIHQRYGFGSLTPLYVPFLGERIQRQALKKTVSNEEYTIIRQTFTCWQSRFEAVYETELPALRLWQKKLRQTLLHHPGNDRILTLLSKLYVPDQPVRYKDISLFPVISVPSEHTYATAYPEKSAMLLPLSAVFPEAIMDTLGIIWHEIIHLYFDQPFFIPRLQKIFPNDLNRVSQVMELTASALFPGLLAHRFFKTPLPKVLHKNFADKDVSAKVLKIMVPYVENEKLLDEKYIRQIGLLGKK